MLFDQSCGFSFPCCASLFSLSISRTGVSIRAAPPKCDVEFARIELREAEEDVREINHQCHCRDSFPDKNSHRASSRTSALLSEGMARKSKLSRLLTMGNPAWRSGVRWPCNQKSSIIQALASIVLDQMTSRLPSGEGMAPR